MPPHPLFKYLRLKLVITFIRTLIQFSQAGRLEKDNLLAQTHNTQRHALRIPSRQPGRFIAAELFSPPASTLTGKLPIVINWHGSGFVFPLHGSDALFCAQIAAQAGVFVLDADYRKSPEHPFPSAVEDAEDVLRWVAGQGERFDTGRAAVTGFSAGGNLALVAASTLRKGLVGISIAGVVAHYPVTDLAMEPERKRAPRPGGGEISPFLARLFNDCYVPDREMRGDPRVSPAKAALGFSGRGGDIYV